MRKEEGAVAGMVSGLAFTFSDIAYCKLIDSIRVPCGAADAAAHGNAVWNDDSVMQIATWPVWCPTTMRIPRAGRSASRRKRRF
jgi:hypothetical protein